MTMFNSGMLYFLTVGLPVLQTHITEAFQGIPPEILRNLEDSLTDSHRIIEEHTRRVREQLIQFDQLLEYMKTFRIDEEKLYRLAACVGEFPFLHKSRD